MLSPTAMSDDAQRKKKVSYEPSALLTAKPSRTPGESAALNEIAMQYPLIMPSAVSSQPSISSALVTRETATVASSTSSSKTSAIQVYPIASLKEVTSTSNGVSTAAGRLCPLAVATPIPAAAAAAVNNNHSLDRKSTLSQGFSQQPQQYVFIVPSNSVTLAAQPQSSQHPFPAQDDEGGQTKRTSKSVIIGGGGGGGSGISSSSINTSMLHQNAATSTTQALQTSTASAIYSKKLTNTFTSERTSKNMSAAVTDTSSTSFRLIAPKQSPQVGSPNSERRGKPRGMKRGSQKPHKLRFHMTTVVTKQKREPVMGSMTVESPSAVMLEIPRSSNSTSPTSSAEDGLDKNVAIESTITFSPNLYSVEGKGSSFKTTPETGANSVSRYKDVKQEPDMEKLQVSSREENILTERERTKGILKEKCVSLREAVSEPKTKGRPTRNYTRRKRELTFHLYEEPGASFRVKKACKE